jgi:hypothetical protein
MDANLNTVMINGIEYVRADQVSKPQPNGNRAVVVVDRGWIFAGDVTEHDGRIYLTRAVWVFRWESIGYAAMLEDWKSSKVDIRPIKDTNFPAGTEIFRNPVDDNWGIK